MLPVIAIDGAAVAPFALKTWLFGPAMALDVVRARAAERRPAPPRRPARGRARLARRTSSDPAPHRSLCPSIPSLSVPDASPKPDLASAER